MRNGILKNARILIVDDHEPNVRLLQRVLMAAGYRNLKSTVDSRQVLSLHEQFEPDIILLDWHMPHVSGAELLKLLKSKIPGGTYLPVLVLTADILPETKIYALSLGAKDFLSKPFDPTEVLLRIANLLETRFLSLVLEDNNRLLETKVRERTTELEEARTEMLERLARASEYRDDNTGQHTHRVGELAALLGRGIGLPEDQVELLRKAAALHDIGKIAIPDGLLLKQGKLTAAEFEQMKTHTTLGAGILSGSRFALLNMAEQIAFYHHEQWDGSGYNKLRGKAIPLAARIVSIADVFDVLTHQRPYKEAWPVDQALAEIERQKGRQFDPDLVDVLLRLQLRKDIDTLSLSVGELNADTEPGGITEFQGFPDSNVLVVDDSPDHRLLLKSILRIGGYSNVLTAESAEEAFRQLGFDDFAPASKRIDLILMDILMPGVSGIEACLRIKAQPNWTEVPVIMVTGASSDEELESAFGAGANDFVTKPPKRSELLARVQVALKLKEEIERRNRRERELVDLTRQLSDKNEMLMRLSNVDGLTEVANRRYFEESLDRMWRRGSRENSPVSLIMADIDCFKVYNETYGHPEGDSCLKQVALAICRHLHRPDDFVARYRGDEFAVLLPATDLEGAGTVANRIRAAVEALGIEHSQSSIVDRVTVTLGIASAVPDEGFSPEALIVRAGEALQQAKLAGRNRVGDGADQPLLSNSQPICA